MRLRLVSASRAVLGRNLTVVFGKLEVEHCTYNREFKSTLIILQYKLSYLGCCYANSEYYPKTIWTLTMSRGISPVRSVRADLGLHWVLLSLVELVTSGELWQGATHLKCIRQSSFSDDVGPGGCTHIHFPILKFQTFYFLFRTSSPYTSHWILG